MTEAEYMLLTCFSMFRNDLTVTSAAASLSREAVLVPQVLHMCGVVTTLCAACTTHVCFKLVPLNILTLYPDGTTARGALATRHM